MSIQILAPDIAAKIAAGEVVERPANVAKELIENSLDAGATEIRVDLRDGGQRLLRVTDNGHGIPPQEVPLAFQRHATSKIRSAEDLDHIASLGFRGEALYSIAAVTNVTLASRTSGEEAAVQMRLESGSVVQQGKAGTPVGTVVTVEHLFHNVPARRKFLRKPVTEAGHITALVQRYALAYPECRFILVNEGRETFRTPGNGGLFDVMVQVYGLERARQMIPFGASPSSPGSVPDEDDSLQQEVEFMAMPAVGTMAGDSLPLRAYGYTSLPTLTRSNRGGIDLFVNRRYVEDRSLTHAVVQAYHTLLPVGRYPMAVVFVEIDSAQVDVNVHPQKTQVRFVDERAAFSAVQSAVRRAVVQQAPVPDMSLRAAEGLEAWNTRRSQILHAGSQPRFHLPAGDAGPLTSLTARQDSHDNTVWSAAGASGSGPDLPPSTLDSTQSQQMEHAQDAVDRRTQEDGPKPAGKLPPLRVVGQVGALYIVAEGPQGVFLIDQHAAHERILYEQFMAQRQASDGGAVASQQILNPVTLHMGHETTGLVAQHLEELNRIGFQIEPFGGDSFLLHAVPVVLSGQDPERVMREIVSSLAQQRDLVAAEAEAQLVKMVCKRAAIKAGQLLSDIEMRELVRQLEACESPRTCPHGRPTMIQLSAGELEKAFGRI